jgi:hypothetical protein
MTAVTASGERQGGVAVILFVVKTQPAAIFVQKSQPLDDEPHLAFSGDYDG